jgi:hypothetical protein
MLESAESFIVASIEAADLVSDAAAARRNGDATPALDAAERVALALEPKIIRIGLVFGPDSQVREKALASSMGLLVFIAYLRDKESTPKEAGLGFTQGADTHCGRLGKRRRPRSGAAKDFPPVRVLSS